MPEVSLLIDGHIFKTKKEVLCEYSDYFRAMFSGNYIENKQQQISIDVVDATSMKIIQQYMENGVIDLTEFSLPTIGDLALAASFLQMTELLKQIEYTLEIQMSINNWMEIMVITENSSFTKLEQLCAAFGLLSFKSMKPEYVPSIHKLFWYLSHPYLDGSSELEVFKFGFQWISNTETGADSLLIILGCLDVRRLTLNDLTEIKNLMGDYANSLAAKVVECFLELHTAYELSTTIITKEKNVLCEQFTERVVVEVLNLVRESTRRVFSYVPTVPVWSIKEANPGSVPHYICKFSQQSGFEKWLEVAERNLWGWSIVGWGPFRLVTVCGEHGRGTGVFMRDVKVYDTLKKEWIHHGVQLPPRRHGGLAVVGDSLFIVGGVGTYRIVLDSALIYNLKERTYREIAKLPDAVQNPAVCSHEDSVYAAGQHNIYRYEDLGDTDRWVTMVRTDIRMSCIMSFNEYIYCTQNCFSNLYRFKPDVDSNLHLVCSFTSPPLAICNLGDHMIFFTRTMCPEVLAVEEYTDSVKNSRDKPKVIWKDLDGSFKLNDVAGSCSLVMGMPPLNHAVSEYHRRYLMRYTDHV